LLESIDLTGLYKLESSILIYFSKVNVSISNPFLLDFFNRRWSLENLERFLDSKEKKKIVSGIHIHKFEIRLF